MTCSALSNLMVFAREELIINTDSNANKLRSWNFIAQTITLSVLFAGGCGSLFGCCCSFCCWITFRLKWWDLYTFTQTQIDNKTERQTRDYKETRACWRIVCIKEIMHHIIWHFAQNLWDYGQIDWICSLEIQYYASFKSSISIHAVASRECCWSSFILKHIPC